MPRKLRFRSAIAVAILVVAASALYAPAINHPWQFDDEDYIALNPVIGDPGLLLDKARASAAHLAPNVRSTLATRHVGYLSFALNAGLGGPTPRSFRTVNIAIHAANAALLYALILVLLSSGAAELRPGARAAAFASALLFTAHPVQTEAVTYICQRFASLATLFYLGAALAYALWRRGGGRTFYALALVSAMLAMKTKEISFTLPVALALYEAIFHRGEPSGRRALALFPFVALAFTIPLALIDFSAPPGEAILGAARADHGISRWAYAATQLEVLALYLRLLALPLNQTVDYGYPLAEGASPGMFAGGAVLIALLAAAIALLRGGAGRPGRILAGFGILWFLLALSVESSFVPLGDLAFEHRLYLPSAGLAIALAGGLASARHPRRAIAMTVAPVLLFAALTLFRNHLWVSEISLWWDATEKAPLHARPQTNLGISLERAGNIAAAVNHYRRAVELNPDYMEAWGSLAAAYGNLGRIDNAIGILRMALERFPDEYRLHYGLGVAYYKQAKYDKAAGEFRRALELMPTDPDARRALGLALRHGAYPHEKGNQLQN
jgi:tetratricopeptide (TPR) repeat protein